ALLADRFKLAMHTETREMPTYSLVLARSDGKPGPKLQPAAVDCDAIIARGRGRAGGAMPGPPAPGAPMQCGMRMAPGNLLAGGMHISELVTTLSQLVGRV